MLLTAMKKRSGLTYEALARRLAVSRSALHRYCSGQGVPPDFAVLEQLGRVCGADRAELLELHSRWAVAMAALDSTAAQPTPTGPAAEEVVPAGATAVQPARRPNPRRRLITATAAVAATMLAVALWAVSVHRAPAAATPRPIARATPQSTACPGVISMGDQGECVRVVQTLLARAGAQLVVDGLFGPETLRRATAFQVLAGLQPRGVVDQATLRALYAGTTIMPRVSAKQVEQLIGRIFTEEPQRAVHIARCQSFLDPLYVLPNTNGTRNWGVFQLSDTLLQQYGGTPRQAFDPTWNVTVAHRVWAEHHDFRAWAHCDA
jgi:plasmid maintenance system antidote protein VapI